MINISFKLYREKQNEKIIETINKNKPMWWGILGHLYGDGGFSSGKVYYTNTNKNLINSFKDNFNFIFQNIGINLHHQKKQDICHLVCSSTILHDFLLKTDIKQILHQDKESKICFLKALFDDEGSVSKTGIITVIMKEELIIDLIIQILNNLGISMVTKYKMKNQKTQREYYGMRIMKCENNKFNENIGFSDITKQTRLLDNPYMYGVPYEGYGYKMIDVDSHKWNIFKLKCRDKGVTVKSEINKFLDGGPELWERNRVY